MPLRLAARALLQHQQACTATVEAAAAAAVGVQHAAAASAPRAAASLHPQAPPADGAARRLSHSSASSSSSPGPFPCSPGAAAAWPHHRHSASSSSFALQQQQQHPHHPHQLQQRAGIFVVVNVRNNNVDAAYGKLNRAAADNGLYEELRKRDHRETNHELAFKAARATFNKRMGQQIRERLKWVVKRRHLK